MKEENNSPSAARAARPDDRIESAIELHPSSLKILLWDIDGTLVRSRVSGAFKKYFIPTMKKVFGSVGNFDAMQFSGMTDTQIIYESLRGEGFTPERIFAKKDELLKIFEEEMKAVFAADPAQHEVLPGVRELLERTDGDPRFVNALLTGNLSVAAEIKLKSVGLWHFFADAPHAFGEHSHNRNDLSVEAGRLFNLRYDYEFSPVQFVVIGDTPNDIACARHFGAKAIGVVTGRFKLDEAELEEKPDHFLPDLSDTEEVFRLLERV